MCQQHWDKLTSAIKVRGLWDLVSQGDAEAARRLKDSAGGQNLANFDPLMAAYLHIVNNAMSLMAQIGANGTVEIECPICHLNFLSEEHDRTCTNVNCKKEKGVRFDVWIQKAADEIAEFAKSLPKQST